MRFKTYAAFLSVVLISCFSAHSASSASGTKDSPVASRSTSSQLQLIGTQSVNYSDANNPTVRIKSQEVRNTRPSGVSGTLSIECWLFLSPFTGAESGYRLGEAVLGTLPAGSSFKAVDQSVPAINLPPDNTNLVPAYYGTFILYETVGQTKLYYDFLNFDGTVIYKNGVVTVHSVPKLSVSSSTVTAKQSAPFSFDFTSFGALPTTYTATGLPIGLELKNPMVTIDTSGVITPLISGTPKKAGTYPVTLTATNADGSDDFALSLVVQPSTVNVPPTITSAFASPNPATTGKRVSFSATATDPENVTPTVTWDFKDGTAPLTGPIVFHTFTTAGTYPVGLSVSDGVNTVTQTISLEVSGAATLDPFIDLVTSSLNPATINVPVTLTATAISPASQTLTYTWNFGDGTPTATGNPVTHAYTVKGSYTVSVTVQDTSLRIGSFSDFTMLVTDSSDPTNLVGGIKTTSPDGVQITVVPSPVGVLALDLALVTPSGALIRDNGAVSFNTGFLIPGRNVTAVPGQRPVSNVNRVGVVVATSDGMDVDNNKKRGRKTIPIGAKDIGETPDAPDTLTDAEKVVTTTKLTGSFNFTSDKADKISATFKIPMPAGFDLLRSQELSLGLSNVADRIVMDAKGKSTGLADRGILQKVAIKYPKHKDGMAVAGDVAQVTVTITAPNLDQAGFESDGITANGGGNKSLQIAIVLAGIPYSGTINAGLKVSTKKDKGTVKLLK